MPSPSAAAGGVHQPQRGGVGRAGAGHAVVDAAHPAGQHFLGHLRGGMGRGTRRGKQKRRALRSTTGEPRQEQKWTL